MLVFLLSMTLIGILESLRIMGNIPQNVKVVDKI